MSDCEQFCFLRLLGKALVSSCVAIIMLLLYLRQIGLLYHVYKGGHRRGSWRSMCGHNDCQTSGLPSGLREYAIFEVRGGFGGLGIGLFSSRTRRYV